MKIVSVETMQDTLTKATFAVTAAQTRASTWLGLPVISTGRPFAFYRRVFFDEQDADSVLADLRGKRVVDVGCGLTPFVPDSMFRACHDAGIEFYAVDPKLADGFRFGAFDRLKVALNRGTRPDPHAPGHERRIAATAERLPFEDASVDLVLAAWLLFVWLSDASALEAVFTELDRVLKVGGQLRAYPTPRWDPSRVGPSQRGFEVHQRFVGGVDLLNLPPAYITTFEKRARGR